MGKSDVTDKWVWSSGGSSLTPTSTTKPAEHGDITGEAPSPKDPDQLLGSLTWATGAAPLALGTPAPKTPQGGITSDAQYKPDGRAAPATFAAGGAALAPAPIVTPQPGKGDIMLTYEGADGQKQTIFGESTWATGGAALVPRPTTHNPGKGDVTGDYGKTEQWQEIATWAAGGVPMVPGVLPPVTDHGDIPDPNTWVDAVVYRTSQLYPLLTIEHLQDVQARVDSTAYQYTEHLQDGAFLASPGIYYLALVTYSNWPIEHMQDSGSFTGGTLNTGGAIHTYSNWPPEHMQDSGQAPSGTLILALLIYSNWPPEHLQDAGIFTGGTLV